MRSSSSEELDGLITCKSERAGWALAQPRLGRRGEAWARMRGREPTGPGRPRLIEGRALARAARIHEKEGLDPGFESTTV